MTYPPRQPSAKVIAFPVRAGWDPARTRDLTHNLAAVGAVHHPRMPKLTPLLLLLMPLICAGSLLSFLAVVSIFLVWLVIVALLVVGAIVFARQFFLRAPARRGFRPQATN